MTDTPPYCRHSDDDAPASPPASRCCPCSRRSDRRWSGPLFAVVRILVLVVAHDWFE